MKISILNWQVIEWNDLSHKWAEVIKLWKEDERKVLSRTHRFDAESKKLVEIPRHEPEPIQEPTEEEQKEQKIREAESLVLRKLALQELEEDTKDIETKLTSIKTDLSKKK